MVSLKSDGPGEAQRRGEGPCHPLRQRAPDLSLTVLRSPGYSGVQELSISSALLLRSQSQVLLTVGWGIKFRILEGA